MKLQLIPGEASLLIGAEQLQQWRIHLSLICFGESDNQTGIAKGRSVGAYERCEDGFDIIFVAELHQKNRDIGESID